MTDPASTLRARLSLADPVPVAFQRSDLKEDSGFRRERIEYRGLEGDVIPAFLLKVIRPRIRWIQCVFHIYPDWRVRPGSKIKNFRNKS